MLIVNSLKSVLNLKNTVEARDEQFTFAIYQ